MKGRIKRIERALTLAFVCLSPVIHHGLISTASEGEYDDVCEDHLMFWVIWCHSGVACLAFGEDFGEFGENGDA